MRKKGKLLPAGRDKYAWFEIYEDYDRVLERYARWIRAQRGRVEMVVDIRSPIVDYLETRRKENPDFTMSGDGVHINEDGHRIIARAVLDAWGEEPVAIRDDVLELAKEREQLLRYAWLTHVGHERPGVREGVPLEEARTRAAEIEKRIAEAAGNAR